MLVIRLNMFVTAVTLLFVSLIMSLYLTPTVLVTWFLADGRVNPAIQRVAHALRNAVDCGHNVIPFKKRSRANERMTRSYAAYSMQARHVFGFGDYNVEHLYRSAIVACGLRHPSNDFVCMGSGANASMYDKHLRRHGIMNMTDMNRAFLAWSSSHDTDPVRIDAGELAYLMCTAFRKR